MHRSRELSSMVQCFRKLFGCKLMKQLMRYWNRILTLRIKKGTKSILLYILKYHWKCFPLVSWWKCYIPHFIWFFFLNWYLINTFWLNYYLGYSIVKKKLWLPTWELLSKLINKTKTQIVIWVSITLFL